MKVRRMAFVAACAVAFPWVTIVRGDPAPPMLWARQLGSGADDSPLGVAVDAGGNSYVTGYTHGDLAGTNQGECDVFVAKYDSAGAWQWTRQIGSSGEDQAWGIAVDASGNSCIAGWTDGDLAGTNQGGRDVFVIKYDSDGVLQWARQIGTGTLDQAYDIALDSAGNSYVTGFTSGDAWGPNQGGYDAFVIKYDSSGSVAWTRQLGSSSDDRAFGVAADGSDNCYLTGYTYGDLWGTNQGGRDAFVAKYDNSGTWQWTRQIGTSGEDWPWSIAADGDGNSQIAGRTDGDLGGPNQGETDAFVVKYDSSGTWQWSRQAGTDVYDAAYGIGADASGNCYAAGYTRGDLGGTSHGAYDAFVLKYDGSGAVQWSRQVGTSHGDYGNGIAVDGDGNSYVGGYTWGDFGGTNQGNTDVFLCAIASYVPIPGDANLDGLVEGGDYTLWADHYLQRGDWAEGDFNGDRFVEGGDYTLWADNYTGSGESSVPEPATLSLLAVGGLMLIRRRRC